MFSIHLCWENKWHFFPSKELYCQASFMILLRPAADRLECGKQIATHSWKLLMTEPSGYRSHFVDTSALSFLILIYSLQDQTEVSVFVKYEYQRPFVFFHMRSCMSEKKWNIASFLFFLSGKRFAMPRHFRFHLCPMLWVTWCISAVVVPFFFFFYCWACWKLSPCITLTSHRPVFSVTLAMVP